MKPLVSFGQEQMSIFDIYNYFRVIIFSVLRVGIDEAEIFCSARPTQQDPSLEGLPKVMPEHRIADVKPAQICHWQCSIGHQAS